MLLPNPLPYRSALRARAVCAQLMLAAVLAAVESALAQDNSVGTPTGSQGSVPSSSYSGVGTPQYQPATAGGYSTSPVGQHLAGTSQLAGGPPLTQSDLFASGEQLLQWGPVHLYPHFLYELSYGNGLQPVPGEQVNTLINQFSPGLMVRVGDHWTLDYTPTLTWYSDSRFQNTLDQAVSLNGVTAYEDWLFGLSMGYSDTTQPLVETAAQTSQDVFFMGLTAAYQVNSKVSLDFSLNQSLRYLGQTVQTVQSGVPEQLANMQEWSTLNWVNYQVEPSLSVGLGLGLTYDNMSVGPDILSEQYQGRVEWRAGNKLTLSLIGGLNDMQFLGSSGGDLLSPIVSLTAQYQLFEPTSLYVSAGTGTSPSYFQAQVSQYNFVSGGIHQRLVRWLFLDISGGYSSTTYQATTTTASNTEISNYNSTTFNAALSTTVFKRVTAAAFFQQAYNSSGAAIYNYNTTEVGLTLGCSF